MYIKIYFIIRLFKRIEIKKKGEKLKRHNMKFYIIHFN